MEPDRERQRVLGRLPEEVVEEISRNIPRWRRFVNDVIGVFSFSFAVGCLGTHHPQIYASISFVFIFVMMYTKRHLFPASIMRLREIPNRDRTDMDQVLLRGAESHFLGFIRSLVEVPLYWVGLLFLFAVLSGIDNKLDHFFK